MKRTIVLATTNPHKIKKLSWIVKPYFSNVVPQDQTIDIEETGNSFEENAIIKAVAISKRYHCHAIASDGGVLIPALGKDWNGVLTKRFIGREDVTDFDRIEALLEIMKGKEGEDRTIIWNEAIAIAKDGRLIFSAEVEGDRGMLQKTYNPEQYQPGIWQCTLTCYPQFGGKNFFELSEEERRYGEISWYHLKEMVDWFVDKKGL